MAVSSSARLTYLSTSHAWCCPTETPSTRDTSDFVAQPCSYRLQELNFEAGLQWNPEDTRSERSQIRLQYRPGNG